ncbi:hypothetical protein DN068_12160 [Taibaiella soli]|uniref:DNA-directed RNA polymerase n=1 Tax=Taibaiella soli TaxID=1649169 RepID=A0A2W2BXN0_9BACT|nr:hypothetical protein DN068_12160 [Taibaiella soli]
MIDTVLKKFMELGICALSLHDSIFVNNESDLNHAEELITQAMSEKHGVKVSFKRNQFMRSKKKNVLKKGLRKWLN